mmetsp:Transcript_28495/g.38910  ORF Transcript_28495/g.38910 Transcript_28495/m.38910 type:complete len:265 (-) Transcript_28495:329-1123(-)|eukprot:CAMPEP_0185755108 /NCGR_PEP_ID=MMETSP1174-20130828/13640_1 /TAXON_ID=35687 /ORGANISM="Dictyocha speculum, Strain CCMP1381" /LENGTH=264 /DNA_ID=CAMNT_0028433541 /DNA_START=230 /DNA_END=1024 /DNA_ORIENTATION=+
MLRAIANYITPTRALDTRPSEVDSTNHLQKVGTHITPEEIETGGSLASQVVMGSPDLRHNEDDDHIASSSQPESKKLPRDNDAGEDTAVHNTIHSGSDDERTGRPDSPQSEENKGRFTHQEKELTQKSSSSAGEADNRESGENILPPDVVKEQAEDKEMDLRQLYLMIKDQQNMVMDVQRNQEILKKDQKELIVATVQKSVEIEAKATQKLMMEQQEKIIELFQSSAVKKIDWSGASDDEDEISPKAETKSTHSMLDAMLEHGT